MTLGQMKGFKEQSLIEGNSERQEILEKGNGKSALVWFLHCHPLPRDSRLS